MTFHYVCMVRIVLRCACVERGVVSVSSHNNGQSGVRAMNGIASAQRQQQTQKMWLIQCYKTIAYPHSPPSPTDSENVSVNFGCQIFARFLCVNRAVRRSRLRISC